MSQNMQLFIEIAASGSKQKKSAEDSVMKITEYLGQFAVGGAGTFYISNEGQFENNTSITFEYEGKKYGIILESGTYGGEHASEVFSVSIYRAVAVKQAEDDEEKEEYDSCLEQIKVTIKELLVEDWRLVYWLFDRQSEKLAGLLYPGINHVENALRRLINEVMLKKYGADWYREFASAEAVEKIRSRKGQNGSVFVRSYDKVNLILMQLDIRDLLRIIRANRKDLKKIDKKKEEINDFLSGTQELDINKIRDFLEENADTIINLWENTFSKLLPEDFKDKCELYIQYRNIVAHNKLLDRNTYNEAAEKVAELDRVLQDAIHKADKTIQSAEHRAAFEFIMKEAMEAHLLAEGRTRPCDYENLRNEMIDALRELASDIEEIVWNRDDINISLKELGKNDSGVLLEISRHEDEPKIRAEYDMDLTDDEGMTSTCTVNFAFSKDSPYEWDESHLQDMMGDDQPLHYLFPVRITKTNGMAEYNDETGLYEPFTEETECESDFDEDMFETVLDLIYPEDDEDWDDEDWDDEDRDDEDPDNEDEETK